MYLLLLKYGKSILGVLALSVAIMGSFFYVKNLGYQEATTKYELIRANEALALAEKVTSLEHASIALAEEAKTANATLALGVDKITAGLKGKTLAIVKNGECYPNKTFSDNFSTINTTVNQSMKESRK